MCLQFVKKDANNYLAITTKFKKIKMKDTKGIFLFALFVLLFF